MPGMSHLWSLAYSGYRARPEHWLLDSDARRYGGRTRQRQQWDRRDAAHAGEQQREAEVRGEPAQGARCRTTRYRPLSMSRCPISSALAAGSQPAGTRTPRRTAPAQPGRVPPSARLFETDGQEQCHCERRPCDGIEPHGASILPPPHHGPIVCALCAVAPPAVPGATAPRPRRGRWPPFYSRHSRSASSAAWTPCEPQREPSPTGPRYRRVCVDVAPLRRTGMRCRSRRTGLSPASGQVRRLEEGRSMGSCAPGSSRARPLKVVHRSRVGSA
jgi:hypothetical protein